MTTVLLLLVLLPLLLPCLLCLSTHRRRPCLAGPAMEQQPICPQAGRAVSAAARRCTQPSPEAQEPRGLCVWHSIQPWNSTRWGPEAFVIPLL